MTGVLLDLRPRVPGACYENTLRDMHIVRAGIGVEIFANTSGWINDNRVYNMTIDSCESFIKWNVSGYSFGNTHHNVFRDIFCQYDGRTLVGIDGINGFRNHFSNVVLWDPGLGASGDVGVHVIISSGAKATYVEGGNWPDRYSIAAGTFSGQLGYQDYSLSGTYIFNGVAGLETVRSTVTDEARFNTIKLMSGSTINRTLPITTQQSGNFAITFTPLSGSTGNNSNLSLYNHNQTDRIYLEHSTFSSCLSKQKTVSCRYTSSHDI